MNKIYNKNMKLLKTTAYGLYERVKNIQESSAYICKTKNGRKNIIKNFNGKELYIHSNYNPLEQARAISEFAFEDEKDIIFIFGMGLAYELKEIIKRDYKKTYFIVEPDVHIFRVMLENLDMEFLTKHNLSLMVTDDPQTINNDFNNLVKENNKTSINLIVLPSYQLIYKDLVDKTFELIKRTILSLGSNFVTNINSGKQWAMNYSNNLKYLYDTQPIETLKKTCKGVPAVIVGAGPSVEENLEHIKKIWNKALIVPAGNGLSVLEKSGIKAHLAGAMDGWQDSEKIFKDLCINKDINLLYSSQVFSLIPNLIKGHKFLLNQVEMDIQINNNLKWDYSGRFSGPSITNVLAFVLSNIGCDPIIFLGQDLCYSKGKKYAQGSSTDNENFDTYHELIKTTNILGEEVYTNNNFMGMKYSMEFCIKRNPTTSYFNGTKYGINIDGAKNIDFNEYVDDILLTKKDYDFNSMINEIFNNVNKDDLKDKVDRFIRKLKKEIEQLIIVSQEIVNYIDSDESKESKEKYLMKKEKELETNEFIEKVLNQVVGQQLDLMYQNKDSLYTKKQKYCYYYDQCEVMNSNMEALYSDILN